MARKAFIHIGLAKTGTTSIQRQLASRRGWLESQGSYYPKTGVTKGFSGHHCLAWNIANSPKQNEFCAGFTTDDFKRDIEKRKDHDIVVSSEELSLLSFNYVKVRKLLGLFSGRDIFVIAYVREQAEFFNSFYLELISDFEDPGPFDKFIEQRLEEARYDYHHWFAIWHDLVGANLVIRPYDRKSMKGSDVVEDFGKVIGLKGSRTDLKKPARENQSLNNLQTAVMAELIRRARDKSRGHPLPIPIRRALKNITAPIMALPELAAGQRFWGIEPELLDRIREKYAAPNANFFETHGLPGFVFESFSKAPAVNLCKFENIDRSFRDRVDAMWSAKAPSILARLEKVVSHG